MCSSIEYYSRLYEVSNSRCLNGLTELTIVLYCGMSESIKKFPFSGDKSAKPSKLLITDKIYEITGGFAIDRYDRKKARGMP